jgi:hypothetical protein
MMQIRRIVTADDPLGEPWPPCDAGLWCVVRRLCGFTMWRAIGWVETAVNEYIEGRIAAWDAKLNESAAARAAAVCANGANGAADPPMGAPVAALPAEKQPTKGIDTIAP